MGDEKEKEVQQLAKNIGIIKCFQSSAIYTPDYYQALCLYEFGYRDCKDKIVLTQEQLETHIKNNMTQFAEIFMQKCVDGGILPAFVKRQLEKTLEEFAPKQLLENNQEET